MSETQASPNKVDDKLCLSRKGGKTHIKDTREYVYPLFGINSALHVCKLSPSGIPLVQPYKSCAIAINHIPSLLSSIAVVMLSEVLILMHVFGGR